MDTPTIGTELPEMYEYIDKMQDYIHRKITVVQSILNFDDVFHSKHIEGSMEGFILGVGAKMFTIAEPVIVYGTVASVVYGIIYWITTFASKQ